VSLSVVASQSELESLSVVLFSLVARKEKPRESSLHKEKSLTHPHISL
jgi:hypothetical protein